MEKIFLASENQKKDRLAILISDKMTLKTVTHKKKYCYNRQRRTLHNHQRINPRRRYNNCKYIYTPNIGAPQCLRQILTDIKGEIDSNIIIMCVC